MIKRSSSAGKSKQSEEPVQIVEVKQAKLPKKTKKKDVISTELFVKTESLKMENEPMEEAEPHKTMFDFEQYLQAQFGAPKQETIASDFTQTKGTQFKFTPTMSSVHVEFAKPKETSTVQ